jgi:hypothetical protein
MTPPPYRSVAVHWPRLFAGAAAMTGVLMLAVEWEPLARVADPVFDSPVLAFLTIGVLMAAVVGFARPWADYEVSELGIIKREGLFFSLFRGAHAMPWEAIKSAMVMEEMDGSRSFTLRTNHGAEWKVWEKFGTRDGFDAFRQEVATRLERRPRGAWDAAPVALRSAWDGAGARTVVAALAVAWLALALLTATGPAEGRGERVARLLAMALILAPLVWRAFLHRRDRPLPSVSRQTDRTTGCGDGGRPP